MIPSTTDLDPLMQKKNKLKIVSPKIINANTIATTHILPYKPIYYQSMSMTRSKAFYNKIVKSHIIINFRIIIDREKIKIDNLILLLSSAF